MWSHTFLNGCVIVHAALHSVLELSRSVFHGWLEPNFTLPLNETALWKFYAQWCFCPKVSCSRCWTSNIGHWTTLHIVDTMLNINIEHWTMFMLHWTWSLSTLRWTSDFTSSSSDFLLDQAMDHKRQRIWDVIPFRIKCPAHIFSLSKRIPT